MYITSGHLQYYADSMYPPMELEGVKYYLKAMNCPHHHKIFAAEPKSYKDLPLRLAEYGTCYRYEQSGELFGLMRVRCLHLFEVLIFRRFWIESVARGTPRPTDMWWHRTSGVGATRRRKWRRQLRPVPRVIEQS